MKADLNGLRPCSQRDWVTDLSLFLRLKGATVSEEFADWPIGIYSALGVCLEQVTVWVDVTYPPVAAKNFLCEKVEFFGDLVAEWHGFHAHSSTTMIVDRLWRKFLKIWRFAVGFLTSEMNWTFA